jgi:hypothetical protein
MIETMCNEILGNYTKKEDQLMAATFGTRDKRRLNWVMDALGFKYPDYENFEEAKGVKRKRVVSIIKSHAMRSIQEDKKRHFQRNERFLVRLKFLSQGQNHRPLKMEIFGSASC